MTSSEPLVSVVIAVRNGEAFLGRALTSIQAQTYPAVEIVVVDDGSSDETATVATDYGVDRVVTCPTNLGVSTARNIGTAVASGELIVFHDADDEMVADKLERQVAALVADSTSDGVMTRQRVVVDEGAALPPWLVRATDLLDEPSDFVISTMFRVAALLRSGGFDPTYRTSEDIELLIRLTVAGSRIDRLTDVSLIRHIHGKNATYDDDAVSHDLLRAVAPLTRRRAAPRVSVVIPVHDGAKYLGEALMSVRNQTGVDPSTVQIVVVDDGSTDGSAEVALRADVGATVVRQPRLGPGAARNHGVLLSRGRHLAFLDADDVWTPSRLAAQLALLDDGVDAVFGQVEEFVDDAARGSGSADLRYPRATAIARLPSALVIRREAFARAGMFTADRTAPDAALWYARAVDAGLTMADVDQVVVRRRLHGNNHSLRGAMAQSSYPKALKDILDRRRAAQ